MQKNNGTLQDREDFIRGFDHGNYGNAYVTQDWEAFWEANLYDDDGNERSPDFQEGMMLGFFSSYELDEISDEVAREDVKALREKYKEEL